MATMGPHAMLLMMSSPHARRGPLWQAFSRYYGKEDAPVLVWRAPTKVMNPLVPAGIIDALFETDPARAAAEYGAEFRTDVETYVSREAVEACVIDGRYELAPVRGFRYFAFCDPSGGSSDSMTLCIAHREGDEVIIDAIRERKPPFSPDDVVIEFAACLKSYFIGTVSGDRYAGLWPGERFAARGVRYEPCEQSKSDLYQALLPAINAKRVQLLDHPRLVSQLCSLERRTTRAGRDSIDHPPGGAKDDVANALAGAVSLALANQGVVVTQELLARVMQMPIDPHRAHSAWGWRKRLGFAALANMIPSEKRVMPASVLPGEKFEQPSFRCNSKEKDNEAHA
jgi:hypothetical protein